MESAEASRAEHGEKGLRVVVDDSLCSGHGRCYTLAPGVFESDGDGFNAARGSTVEVPAGKEAEARIAIEGCPEGAIRQHGGD